MIPTVLHDIMRLSVLHDNQETYCTNDGRRPTVPHDNRRLTLLHDNSRLTVLHDNRIPTVLHDNRRPTVLNDNRRLTVLHHDMIPTVLNDNRRLNVLHDNRRLTVLHDNRIPTVLHDNRRPTVLHDNRRLNVLHHDMIPTVLHDNTRLSVLHDNRRLTVLHDNRRLTVLHDNRRPTVLMMTGDLLYHKITGNLLYCILTGDLLYYMMTGDLLYLMMTGNLLYYMMTGGKLYCMLTGDPLYFMKTEYLLYYMKTGDLLYYMKTGDILYYIMTRRPTVLHEDRRPTLLHDDRRPTVLHDDRSPTVLHNHRSPTVLHNERRHCVLDGELGDLLYYMMTCYNDTDVQDKARFYYALITGATDKKVHSVLKTSLSDVESMTEAITSLLPGTTNKVSLAKIIPLDDQVFSWQRISVSTATQRLKSESAQDSRSKDTDSTLLQYEEGLKNLQVTLDLNCRLKLRKDSKFSRVHAVSIHVEGSQTFQPIPNRHIPCLPESGHQDVVLKVVPKLPLPLSLICSVEFSSDSKQTFSTVIDLLYIEFPHLLMKLPWKPSDDKKIKFSTLWEWVLNRKTEDRVGVESVKLFSISIEKFKQVHDKHLSQFLFDEQKDLREWCYTIFLPPCYHVLLKCRCTGSDSLVVSIATDLWTILSHIDTFLDDIIK